MRRSRPTSRGHKRTDVDTQGIELYEYENFKDPAGAEANGRGFGTVRAAWVSSTRNMKRMPCRRSSLGHFHERKTFG